MSIKILITCGPTREYIDPVRFISNASSGKMGKAIADEALKNNIEVVLVKGPCDVEIKSKKCKVINVVTAQEMLSVVKKNLKKIDIFIGAAAVADYRPLKFSQNKIKKNNNNLTLNFVKNPDIISYVAKHKTKKQIVVGFALENKNLITYAKDKLIKKNLDMIVANGVSTIGSKNSKPVFIFKDLKTKRLKLATKQFIAKEIINESKRLFNNNKVS